jgi:hypothetical protein
MATSTIWNVTYRAWRTILLNMRLSDDIDQETFARKHTEFRDRLSSVKQQLDVLDRSHDEKAELASKVFELSQTLRQKWVTADYAAKRRILGIVFLNCRLEDATLVPTMRKPFDVVAEGLTSQQSRGDKTAIELFIAGVGVWEAHLQQLVGRFADGK